MHQYTTAPPADPLKQAQGELNNVKDIMVQNIDSILQRGERLDLLVDKTDTLAGQAYAFRRGARNVRRQQWWKNTRITVLTGFVCVVSTHCTTYPAPPVHLYCPVLRTVPHPLRRKLTN